MTMTKKTKPASNRICDEDFVRVWQESKSLYEVAEHAGQDRLAVARRASHMRKLGIPLKSFRDTGRLGRPAIDTKGLSAIAKKHAP